VSKLTSTSQVFSENFRFTPRNLQFRVVKPSSIREQAHVYFSGFFRINFRITPRNLWFRVVKPSSIREQAHVYFSGFFG